MIKEFSLKDNATLRLSKNFVLNEFKCRDGSDKVILDTDLIDKLQQLRDYIGKPINILSGYRTEEYNELINGSTNSYHCKGMAADIYVKENNDYYTKLIALWSEFNGLGGVGCYINRDGSPQSFVHIDTRENRYRWWSDAGYQSEVENITEKMI